MAASERPSGLSRIGRYEIVRLLGTGSFAAVYLAHDPALDADVAIKVLADHHSAVPDLRERFVREARLLRRLGTERVVTVHDVGEINGQPYFVMEALEAGTLADRVTALSSGSSVPPTSTIRRIVTELSACLAAVHDGGVVHRDVKPSNIMIRGASRPGDELLADGEQLVLGDFGLARDAELSSLTIAGGTAGFVAPEQRVPSSSVDQRADVYSASATIASLLVGRPLDTDPLTHLDALPVVIRDALAVGLAVDPEDRFDDIASWERALTKALDSGARTSSPVSTSTQPLSREPAGSDPAVRARRTRRRVVVAAVALLVVAGVAALALRIVVVGSPGQAENGPRIIGPTELVVGEAAVFTHERAPESSYVWSDATGAEFTTPSIEVAPTSSGTLELTLTETVDGVSTSTTIRVVVADAE